MYHWLKVSRSDYYDWLKRSISLRTVEDAILSIKIFKIHKDSRGAYGSPRVYEALKKQGVAVGKKRVERLMQAQRLQGRVVKVTRRQPGSRRFKEHGENLCLGISAPSTINRIWVADITDIKVRDSYKFLSVIMDLYSRRILSWSLTDTRTTEDTVKILKRAIHER